MKYYRTFAQYVEANRDGLISIDLAAENFADHYAQYRLDMFIKVCKMHDIDLSSLPTFAFSMPEFIDSVEPTAQEIAFVKQSINE